MEQRIIGFDLARAYAIFGMYIVNFNIVFGNYKDPSLGGKLLSLFSGNSSTLFVMLAGMGVALMSRRLGDYTIADKKRLTSVLNKRAWFLFVLGLLLYLWWPADILHFYGGYMHIAAFFLFAHKRYYLYGTAAAIVIFHLLLLLIPYETGWDFELLQYKDFWTWNGFLRNTFYNGWNSVFPWMAYFFIGMYLGRLDWSSSQTQSKIFGAGVVLYLSIVAIQFLSTFVPLDEYLLLYINADYLPPFLPFMMSTVGFGLMLIVVFMYLGQKLAQHQWANDLAKTGQMTLTHYVTHLTLGMLFFALITGKKYTAQLSTQDSVKPGFIFLFSVIYFMVSVYFSKFWARKFKHGPFEILMRKISN